MSEVRAFGVPGLGEVVAGEDLASSLLRALSLAGTPLLGGDVLVVSSKIVSKAEGRALAVPGREQAVADQTARVVAERITPRGPARIVQSRSGPVLAAAGVDASNVAAGTVLLLPADPDASARGLRRDLATRTGLRLAVVISDTAGRPWREGQADIAIGAAGLMVVEDLRGTSDPYGNPLEVTVRAVADEIAGLADLVKGKLDGVPAAVVRGVADWVGDADGPGAAALLREAGEDWFRLGHVEAVRTALGVPPGTPGVDPVRVPADGVPARLRRALQVALRAADPFGPGSGPAPATSVDPDVEPVDGAGGARARVPAGALTGPAGQTPGAPEALVLGAVAQRIAAAAWTEDLVVEIVLDPGPPPTLVITARAAPPGPAAP